MPLCTLHLISLNSQTTISQFVISIKSWGIKYLTLSHVIRWIIVPEHIDKAQLLEPTSPYSLLLIYPGTKPLPGPVESKVANSFTLQIGIPSRLLKDFSKRNNALLHPEPKSIPKLTGALSDPIIDPKSSQTLTLSPELQSWINSFGSTHEGKGAVSMLNLLSFKPDMKESYLEYGKAFASSIGSNRGGDAKLVGHVVYPPSAATDSSTSKEPGARTRQGIDGDEKWDEFALAHYPSIMHFADMLASKDYQEVNQKYRVPALRDTCILCTSEIEIDEMLSGGKGGAKL